MKSKVFALLVNNNAGLLSRVAGLFSRRGYNIDSITSGATMDDQVTRITVVASGDDQILTQIEKQLAKLEDVIDSLSSHWEGAIATSKDYIDNSITSHISANVSALKEISDLEVEDLFSDVYCDKIGN